MRKNHLFRTGLPAVTAAASLLPLPAATAAPGAYLGASVGSSAFNDNFEGEEIDENEVGWKVFAGYRFGPYFAIEGGYLNFGEVETGSQAVQNVKLESDAWDIVGVVTLPAGPIDLFAKAGIAFWNFDTQAAAAAVNDDGEDFIWGVGGQWNLGNLGIRFEYERIELAQPHEISMISAGLVWNFGR